ncbi:MAG TPA: VOC family protein, partial [Gemmatimonadaceae bacterium]|nr:VOC family protein [Gemmatimonadaceae bacterium]
MSATAPTAIANRGRFAWHELLTTDTAAAKAFYGSVVGWGTTDMEGGPIPYTLWTSSDVPTAGLMTLPAEAAAMGAPPHWLAYTEVPDPDATVEQVTKLGGKVLSPAMTVPQAGRFAVLQDPFGATFGVIASAMALQEETDPQPLEFSWHELTTDDLGTAISFYEAIFGWKKQSEFDMGDMGVYH